MRGVMLDRRRRQCGQSLVGALITMVLLFSMAGGLIFAVSALLDHQINTGNLFVADFGTQSSITAGAAYVAGHGLSTGAPLCSGSQPLPGLGSGGELTGVWCRQIDNIAPGTPAVVRLAWAGSCSLTAVNGAGGRHVLIWFSAVGATSAYIDGSASGCSGAGLPYCSASTNGDLAQLALDCDLSSLAAPYLHISNAAQGAGSIRFSQYAGPFLLAPGSPLPVANGPAAIAAADLNHDALPDLVVGNHSSDSVSVLLGNGGARFASAATVPAGGPDPAAVAIADVNGDDIPDLLVLTHDDQQVHVLPGNGDGTFQPARTAAGTPANPVTMVAADFNGDGRTDLAVLGGSGSNQLVILLGDGGGTFTAGPGGPIIVGGKAGGLVAADLNRDGKVDLAVTESAPNHVQILLGRGDGTFTSFAWVGVGSNPGPIAAADLNGDGIPDLVVGNRGDGTLSALLGQGGGTFAPATGSPVSVGGIPASIAIGDSNGDGRPDVAVANAAGSSVTVLYGAGDGSLRWPLGLSVGTSPLALVAHDLDGDGAVDLAVANSGSGNVTVYRGNRQRASVFMLGAPAPRGAAVRLEEGDVVVSADGRTTTLAFEGAV